MGFCNVEKKGGVGDYRKQKAETIIQNLHFVGVSEWFLPTRSNCDLDNYTK